MTDNLKILIIEKFENNIYENINYCCNKQKCSEYSDGYSEIRFLK